MGPGRGLGAQLLPAPRGLIFLKIIIIFIPFKRSAKRSWERTRRPGYSCGVFACHTIINVKKTPPGSAAPAVPLTSATTDPVPKHRDQPLPKHPRDGDTTGVKEHTELDGAVLGARHSGWSLLRGSKSPVGEINPGTK